MELYQFFMFGYLICSLQGHFLHAWNVTESQKFTSSSISLLLVILFIYIFFSFTLNNLSNWREALDSTAVYGRGAIS